MAETTSNLAVGDRLVYPNQGLCTVTEIKTEEIAGQKLTFVSLVIIETGAKVKVPREKLEKNGVRRVSTADDVKKVIDYLKSDSEKASLDWKKRARDNTARLSEGGLIGLAEVVKGLQVLSELRPLPPKEREQYNDARHLFVEELAAAMGVSAADAEDAFDILLFVPGKERPKRSIEEFQGMGGEDDELGLDGDLMGLDGEESSSSEESSEGEEKSEEGEGEEGDEDGEKKKPKKPAAAPAAPKLPKGAKKSLLSDLEVTAPAATALENAPKKRGRPPKPKPEVTEPPPPPKKRGRPPKPKPEVTEPPPPPKKRGRPPKPK
ncbi:MAG: CarD family transcriptional regulator [Myxococcaceae bacterium]